MAQLMPLPLTVFCFSKIQIAFTFLVPAYLGSPGKIAIKRVCVCVCVKYPENYVFLCEQHLIDENVSINCIIACATRGYINAANLWGLGRIVFTAVQ